MRPRSSRAPHTLALLAASLCACTAPPVFVPEVVESGTIPFEVRPPREQVDVLFVVDNSPSMEPMSGELRKRFQQFIAYFRELAKQGKYADLHIGVVTSDYGAGPSGVSNSHCVASPGPLAAGAGHLVRRGAAAASDCKEVLGPGAFLSYRFGPGGDTSNLPDGETPEKMFTCMASVGTEGCGFEHVLESAYAALHDNLPENEGFLRPDAFLAVVFVTNEDDCSGPPASELFEASTNRFGYMGSFRCARFGIACGGAPLPASATGPLASCAPAIGPAGGQLYDISRYVDLFQRPASQGGLKANPEDVILVGITPPDAPVQVVMTSNMNAAAVYPPCGDSGRCDPVVQRSCTNPQQPAFYGDPAVRLNAVIRSGGGTTHSICADDYSGALDDLTEKIGRKFTDGCIERRLADRANPDCAVEQITPGAAPAPMPRCDRANGALPCWRVEEKAACEKDSPEGLGVTIDRGGAPFPSGASVRIQCAVLGGT